MPVARSAANSCAIRSMLMEPLRSPAVAPASSAAPAVEPAAIEFAFFFSFGNIGAGTSARKESRNSRPAGPDAFGKRPLRIEFNLKFTREVLLGEQLVLAHV